MRRIRLFAPLVLVGAVVLAAACGDEGPASGPGPLTAVVVSPNGAEGAAVITLRGSGIGDITATTGQVFSREDSDLVTVVVIHEPGGELSFQVAVSDTTQTPTATIEEVAAPNDVLRTTLAGYSVEFRR